MKQNSLQVVLQRIGAALSTLRVNKGYASISDFASEYGLPLIQYWRIEKGKANITIRSLMKLLAIHDIPINEFFCSMRQYK